MKERKEISLDVYKVYDSVIPLDYFELWIQDTEDSKWNLYYIDKDGEETTYGPFSDAEILENIGHDPFFLEEIVFVYYLIEHEDPEVKMLGVNLLKIIASNS